MGVDDVVLCYLFLLRVHCMQFGLHSQVCVWVSVCVFGLGLSFNFGLAQKVKAAKNKKKLIILI